MLTPPERDEDEVAAGIGIESGNGSRVWAYAPGPKAQFWEEFYREGIMAVGWDELGNLAQYPDQAATGLLGF